MVENGQNRGENQGQGHRLIIWITFATNFLYHICQIWMLDTSPDMFQVYVAQKYTVFIQTWLYYNASSVSVQKKERQCQWPWMAVVNMWFSRTLWGKGNNAHVNCIEDKQSQVMETSARKRGLLTNIIHVVIQYLIGLIRNNSKQKQKERKTERKMLKCFKIPCLNVLLPVITIGCKKDFKYFIWISDNFMKHGILYTVKPV